MTREEREAVRKGDYVYRAHIGQDTQDVDRVVVTKYLITGLAEIYVSLRAVRVQRGVEVEGHMERIQKFDLIRYALTRVAAVETLESWLLGDRDSHYRQAKEADARASLATAWLHLNGRPE